MTLNVNGLGAKAILQQDGAALAAGQIVSGSAITVIYDGAAFRLENYVSNPKFSGTVSADAVSATTITGTLSGNGAAITAINASNIATGTIADTRLPATMSGKSFTTDVSINQTLSVGTTNGGGIEVGRTNGTASPAFIDFHTSATAVDYNVRLNATGDTANAGGTLDILSASLKHNGAEVWDTASLPTPAVQGTQIVAGNGLTGGGTLAATRTITLGAPGTITNSTTNTVSATSHTHALTLVAADITGALGYVPSKGDGLPIGAMIMIYGNDSSAPPGFLLANGAVVTTTYPELRAFGLARGWAVTSGNPRLPDMGGYFPRGWRTGQTVDSGRAFGSVQQDAMQAHRHQRNPSAALEGVLQNPGGNGGFYNGWNKSAVEYQTTGDVSDGRTADETRPSNITVTYWVKAYDVDNTSGSINLSNVANDVTALQSTVSALGTRRQSAITPSGTSYTFLSIPAGVQRIGIKLSGFTVSADQQTILKLGTAAQMKTSGYVSRAVGFQGNALNSQIYTDFFPLIDGNITSMANVPIYSFINLRRSAPGSNKWLIDGQTTRAANGTAIFNGGTDIGAELTRIEITTATGTATLGGANSLAIEWKF